MRVALAYVPVLHSGYIKFFKDSGAQKIYVIGEDILDRTDYLRKDLRALKPKLAIDLIRSLDIFESVDVLEPKDLRMIDKTGNEIIAPDEDVSREIGKHLKKANIKYSPIFLRWDRRSIESANKSVKNKKVSSNKADKILMKRAYKAAAASSDIWRRVGAILLDKSGKEIGVASNQGEPSAHTPWIEGDPRNIFKQGSAIEFSLFTHAEAALIAQAAKNGNSIKGGSLYVTTFPCPACAKLIAKSGITKMYYSEGYGVLDGERVLTDYGVQLKQVPIKMDADNSLAWVPYKKKT